MDTRKNILILSDRPDIYLPVLERLGKTGHCIPTAKLMTRQLLSDSDCEGIVLDAKMVMATDPDTRDKLFALCGTTPVIRSRILPNAEEPTFLDPLSKLDEEATCTAKRVETRVRVRLEAVWAADTDPAMIDTNEGVLLNLSSGGAFLHAPHVMPSEEYLYLKILELDHKRPIHCAVRWRLPNPPKGQHSGAGIQFLDLTATQLKEIQDKHLQPAS